MPFVIDIEKVERLMVESGIKKKNHMVKMLIDVDHSSFWKLMGGKTKNCRTTLNITVRMAKALGVKVEDIIKEIP